MEKSSNFFRRNYTNPNLADSFISKPPKPSKFDGSDSSLNTVKTWAYEVEEYMDLARVPLNTQTRYARTFLSSPPKLGSSIITRGFGPFLPWMTSLWHLRSSSKALTMTPM